MSRFTPRPSPERPGWWELAEELTHNRAPGVSLTAKLTTTRGLLAACGMKAREVALSVEIVSREVPGLFGDGVRHALLIDGHARNVMMQGSSARMKETGPAASVNAEYGPKALRGGRQHVRDGKPGAGTFRRG